MKNREKFHDRITPEPNSGCWLWTGAMITNGYGIFYFEGQYIRAHRYSWELHRGAIPNGIFVLHRCDVPSCVNPDHLFLGNQSDNMKDAANKRRLYVQRFPNKSNLVRDKNLITRHRGEKSHLSKLTEGEIFTIRQMSQAGQSNTDIARIFNVGRPNIFAIVTRKTWKHIGDTPQPNHGG